MSNKTVIVILTIAALLVGFIFLFERDTMTTTERMGRKGRVFTEFRKEAVTRLEITQKGQAKVVIEREKTAGVEEETRWRITAPRSLEADETEVLQILSAIDFLLVDRAIRGADKINDPAFGLKDPKVRATFWIGGKSTSFRLGEEARGEKIYLASDAAPDAVYAVGGDILTSLDKGVNDLRDKHLVREELNEIATVRLERPDDTVELKKEKETWKVKTNGTWVLAGSDQVRELVDAVEQLEAEEFIADDVKDAALSGYGLSPAEMTFETTVADQKKLSLLVGKACPGDDKRRYASVKGSGTVACVSDAFTQVASRPLIRFQETRPAVFATEDVIKMVLSSKGTSLTFARKAESGWQLEGDDVALDGEAVDALLTTITETRASKVAAGEGAVTGLGDPAGEAVFTLADEMGDVSLQWFDGDESGARLRRRGEPAVLTVPAVLVDKLRPDVLAFRSKRLENAEPHDAIRVSVKGPSAQTLEKKDGKWTLTAPLESATDETAVRKLVELVAKTHVEAFVAARADAGHGLTPPFAEIAVQFETVEHAHHGESAKTSKKEVVLQLGGKNEIGKRYARLKGGDPTVFTVGEEYETTVSRPLIARDLFQVDDTRLRKLSIATAEKTLSLTRSADTWQADDKTPVDTVELGHIVADLGGVKTVSAVSFGDRDAAFGEVRLTVTAGLVDDEDQATEKTFTVGDRSADTTEDGYLARVDGVDATFVLPARIIDQILSLVPSSGETAPPKP